MSDISSVITRPLAASQPTPGRGIVFDGRTSISKSLEELDDEHRFDCFDKMIARDLDWWSQTGSNRRPPACKAGALPTELWPLQGSVIRDQVSGQKAAQSDSRYLITDPRNWWAWEDLNFRPHAYQARALTN